MKRLLKVFIAIMMSISLVGCSESKSEDGYKVMILKQMDHASLDEIAESIEAELDALSKEKNITINYETVSGQGDATILKQYADQAVSDEYDAIIPIATMAAQQAAASCKNSDTKVIFAAVSDPESAGLTGMDYVTGTSDALNTPNIIDIMLAINPDLKKVGLLYSKNETNSTASIEDAKAIFDTLGIEYIEYTANNTEEAITAVNAAISDKVEAVFTPTDNIIMASEIAIYGLLMNAGIPHYAGADSFVKKGAFLTCGVNYVNLGTATADITYNFIVNGVAAYKDAELTKDFYTMDGDIITVNKEVGAALNIDYSSVLSSFGEVVEVNIEG